MMATSGATCPWFLRGWELSGGGLPTRRLNCHGWCSPWVGTSATASTPPDHRISSSTSERSTVSPVVVRSRLGFLTARATETVTRLCIQRMHMSTSIRVSDETKSMLSVIKEEDESWDEFLSRLARRERDVSELGGFADEGIVEDMEETENEMNESFEENIEEADDLSR